MSWETSMARRARPHRWLGWALALGFAATGCAGAGDVNVHPTFEPSTNPGTNNNGTDNPDNQNVCGGAPAACDGQCCPALPPSGDNFAIHDMVEGDLVVDKSNVPHIVFRAATGEVRHASFENGRWRVSRISTAAGYGISVVADASGNTHACYRDAADEAAATTTRYVRLEGGSWKSTSFPNTVGRCAVAVDKGGEAHLLYRSASAGLVYARHSGANWIQATIPTTAPTELAVAVNGDGLTHLAFLDNIAGVPTIRYTNTNDVKNVVTVATGTVHNLVMRATSKNAAHIVFVRSDVADTGDEVDFARSTDTGWLATAAIGNLGSGATIDMSIDGHDSTHVLVNRPGEDLSLYKRTDGAFNAEAVMQDFITTTAHLACDTFGRSHILGIDEASTYGTFQAAVAP